MARPSNGRVMIWRSTPGTCSRSPRISEISTPMICTDDLHRWQAETGLPNNEAADFLGVSLSTW